VKEKNETRLEGRNTNSRKNNKRARKYRIKFQLLSRPDVPKLGNGGQLNHQSFQQNKKDYFLKSTIKLP